MMPEIFTVADRYRRLFNIAPGQHIHLGKHLPDVWKHQFRKCHVSTDKLDATPCDLMIETNITKNLNLIEKGGLDKFITKNGSALMQISSPSRLNSGRIRRFVTRCIQQNNSKGVRIALPDDAAALHYFALYISPSLENPSDIIILPCTINRDELYIPKELSSRSGSIAVLATKSDTPFSHMLCDLPDNTMTASSNTITRVMFRERGTLVIEIKDASDNLYISRSSLTAWGEKNIEKNYHIIGNLHSNLAIPQDTKQLIPGPVAKTFNTSIEEKKPGQLAWEIIRQQPDLEPSIIAQAWDFSVSLCISTGRAVKIDSEQFDAIVLTDLKRIQQHCHNDNKLSRLLVLINEYLLEQLLGNEMYVVFGHGDFGYGNILCDSKTASLTGVIDWDTSRDIELPCVDFINLLIQKSRSHNSLDKSYQAALRWLTSEQPLPTKIRGQMHEKFGITDKDLKLYSLVSILHLMGRDFRFREAGSLKSEEKDTLIQVASSIEQPTHDHHTWF